MFEFTIIGLLAVITYILWDFNSTQKDVFKWIQRHTYDHRVKDFDERGIK